MKASEIIKPGNSVLTVEEKKILEQKFDTLDFEEKKTAAAAGNKFDSFRDEKLNSFIDERKKYYMQLYNRSKKSVFIKLYTLEFDGGKCFNCKKPWKKHEIDNQFLRGKYFTPECDCFIQCPECESYLYDLQFEFKGHLKYCDNCGFKLIETETGKLRYGSEYFSMYNNLSRKRQIEIIVEGRI